MSEIAGDFNQQVKTNMSEGPSPELCVDTKFSGVGLLVRAQMASKRRRAALPFLRRSTTKKPIDIYVNGGLVSLGID